MQKLKLPKWPWIILIIIIILMVAASALAIRVARGGLPTTSGTVETDLSGTVEIYRDQYGVPHIVAATMEDLFFGQGYAQAQDRLWQMDLSRRAVSGKLSEILGEDMVETDLFTLTVGFYRAAEKNLGLASDDTLNLFDAYSAGVNAYIEANRGNLPPEFTLIGYSPEPWTALDSLAIGIYMSWYLGGNMQAELFHASLTEAVGLDLAMEIFPDYPDYGPIVSHGEAQISYPGISDDDSVAKLVLLSEIAELNGSARYVPGLGSNNWVISGDLAPGQGALLANDMHLAMGLPSIWHCAHLYVKDEMNVTGVVFPGVPSIIVGFNNYIAWGFTNTGPDVQDLYILELNPDNPYQYRYMGEWRDAEVISEEFMVKGESDPREVEVLISHFGPVISSVVELETPISLRWTALGGTREFDAILGYMKARNWEEFTAALENFMTPTQNMVYADRDGNIGFRANGLIPIRRSGNGLLPVDGTTDQYEWIGYIPYDELPTLYNPPEGIIVTANHRIVDDDYPYLISSSWAPPYRAMGIWRELEGKSQYTFEDMIRAQTSFYNMQAEILGPVFINALKTAELSDLETEAMEIFAGWLKEPYDYADQVGPAIYNVLYMNLLEYTFSDQMGEELYERFLHNRASTNAFDRMLLTGESGWFNIEGTAEVENRDDIIILSFSETVIFLEESLGKDPAGWHWGKLHDITLKHNLGSAMMLSPFYNRGPYPVGGSFHTPATMSYLATDPFAVTHSAPWRYMVDMSDRSALDVMAGGISGHPLSDHYNDQTELWLAGEYKEMIFDPETVLTLPEKLILKPRQ